MNLYATQKILELAIFTRAPEEFRHPLRKSDVSHRSPI